ncbi:alpha/beta fold hydrolase [Polaromonas sp. P2-4]|nr:alpha/beta fold hydrolase [Polaromonas sp. P2-4]
MDALTRTADDLLQAPLALLDSRFPQRIVALPSGAHVALRECGAPGDAPTVVLLHGISSRAASWLHPAVLAGAQVHVIAWDAPGYGDSTPLQGDAPLDTDYAARLHELLQVLDVRRCVLVGHSLGALMACAYARDLGANRVARVVLISPAGGYGAAAQAAASARCATSGAMRCKRWASTALPSAFRSACSRRRQAVRRAPGCSGMPRICSPQATCRPSSCCAPATLAKARA